MHLRPPSVVAGVQVAKPPDALCQTVTVVTVDTMAINSDKVSRTTHRVCTVEITDVDATLRDGVVDSAGEDDNNDDSMAIFAHRSPASTPPVADRGGVPGNGRRGGQPAPALAPRTLARASLTRATVDIKMSQQTQVSGRKKSPGQMRVRTKVVMVHPVCRAALECGAVVEHMYVGVQVVLGTVLYNISFLCVWPGVCLSARGVTTDGCY